MRQTAEAISSATNARGRGWLAGVGVAIALLVAAVFWPVIGHAILNYDDYGNILTNPYYDPLTAGNVAQLWRVPYFYTYAPVTYSVFALERWAAYLPEARPPQVPLDARVFHAGNLGLHLAGTIAVWALLIELTGRRGASACGALLFALHPLQVEPVAWITETKTLLAGLFGVAALWQYVRFARCPSGDAWRWSRYALATGCLLAALLAKPSAAAIPLMALVLDRGWLGRDWRLIAKSLTPWMALAAAIALLTKGQQAGESLEFAAPIWARPLVAADALAFYLEKFWAPFSLATDYGRTPRLALEQGYLWWTWLAPAVVAAAAWWLPIGRQYRIALVLALVALAPVLGLIPFGYQDTSTVADRYMHLALVGPALGLAWFLSRHRSPVWWSLAAIWLVGLAVLSHRQTAVWRDSETLARAGLAVNADSMMLRHILAGELENQGRAAEAVPLYEQAARLYPRSSRAQLRWGQSLAVTGQREAGMDLIRKSVELAPHSPAAQRALAAALAERGQTADAIRYYEQAVTIDPGGWRARLALGDLLARSGRTAEAIRHYRGALEWQHEYEPTWSALARALTQVGDSSGAEQAYREAIRIRPEWPIAYVGLGTLYLQTGRARDALAPLARAVELDTQLLPARQNLATALAAMGRDQEAIHELEIVATSAPDDANVRYSLGNLFARQRQWGRAADQLRQAVSEQPDWIDARLALANVLAQDGAVANALKEYREAVRLAPQRSDAHGALGELLARVGDRESAIQHLKTALSIDPNNRLARAALDRLAAKAPENES
jgi:tetratricopeptide (TPR) repeat protein